MPNLAGLRPGTTQAASASTIKKITRREASVGAGYNGQLVVTAQQVIVGAMLSQHPVDRTLLHPVLDTCRQQLADAGIRPKPRTLLADSGYVSEDNFTRADDGGLRLLARLAKDPALPCHRTPRRARHLDQFPATARAKRRLRHPRGREDYKMRPALWNRCSGNSDLPETDHDVPPRPARVRERMALACAAHNLRKLHRHRTEG